MDYTDRVKKILRLAKSSAVKFGQNHIGTEHILVGILTEKTGIAHQILNSYDMKLEDVNDIIEGFVAGNGDMKLVEREGYSPRALDILSLAEKMAARYGDSLVDSEHLLLAIIEDGQNVAARIIAVYGINPNRLLADTLVAMGVDEETIKSSISSKKDGKKKNSSILEQYSRDLTALARAGKLDPVIGRDEEIARVIQILSRRTKNNPCLVGEPGVGKTAIVEGLALRIVEGNVPNTVINKRLLILDLSGMVAGSKYRGEFEERIKRVMKEVIQDGNIVLFLDELHTIIGAGGAEGAIDASNILKPSLARGEIQLIGATTLVEYRKYVEKDAALERRFQPVTVEEPTEEETVRILKGIAHKYEEYHEVTITEEAMEAAVRLSGRYINDRNLPDKAIDLIDEACAGARLKYDNSRDKLRELETRIKKIDLQVENAIRLEAYAKAGELKRSEDELLKKMAALTAREKKKEAEKNIKITEDSIADVVASWTRIPVSKLTQKESDKLLKLESILHKRVVGQQEAVLAVSRAMRRGRVGLQDPRRPIGSFLFLGPTGVGKTELSKALAEAMFGSENSLIRIDMSEYMEGHAVSKMIGSPPGYVGFDDGGQLSEKVRRNPYSVILFDEIEKAHPDVFNILLQVLDDGHITDSKGRKVSFKNTIIIMTSNAGAQRIVDPKNLGFSAVKDEKKDYEKMKSGVMEEVKKLFKPEFINRIDETIVFHSLTTDDMKSIVTLLVRDLKERCNAQMGIRLNITDSARQYIVSKYTDLKMGARPLKRAIQTVFEDALAEEILAKRVMPGDNIRVTIKDDKAVFTASDK